ncbi:MAG: hypothetical protein ABGY41_02260, partial [Candidatus Poribacteria bacterium]
MPDDPLGRAIAAAERYVDPDDDSDGITLGAGSAAASDESSDSSSDEAGADAPLARKDARRRHYLVTWSARKEKDLLRGDPQQKDPDWSEDGRADFAKAVCRAYAIEKGSAPDRWIVAREKHNDGRAHYHMALQHKDGHRWHAVANNLRCGGFYVDFRETDTYPRTCAYLLEPSDDKVEADLDQAPLLSPGHPPMAGRRRVTDVPRPADECDDSTRTKLKRLDLEGFYELVLDTGIKTRAELLEYASTDRRLSRFYMFHAKHIDDHLRHAWDLANAHIPPPPRPTRMAIVAATAASADPCEGRWKAAAEELLTFQGFAFTFEDVCLHALLHGRGKDANVWLAGETGRGKSFLLQPLLKLFSVFINPAPGRFALQNLPGNDVVLIEDYRCEEQIVTTRTLLTWLDGQPFSIAIPRTEEGARDIVYEESAPVFISSSTAPLVYVGRRIDRGETDQLAARFVVLHFRHYFPNPNRQIAPCAVCFARLLLQALHRTRDPNPRAGRSSNSGVTPYCWVDGRSMRFRAHGGVAANKPARLFLRLPWSIAVAHK